MTRESAVNDSQGIQRVVAEKIAVEMVAERLMELLLKYGSHEQGCMVYINGTCYCGWEELKAKMEER